MADMVADMVDDMEVEMVADIVANMEVDIEANMEADQIWNLTKFNTFDPISQLRPNFTKTKFRNLDPTSKLCEFIIFSVQHQCRARASHSWFTIV